MDENPYASPSHITRVGRYAKTARICRTYRFTLIALSIVAAVSARALIREFITQPHYDEITQHSILDWLVFPGIGACYVVTVITGSLGLALSAFAIAMIVCYGVPALLLDLMWNQMHADPGKLSTLNSQPPTPPD